MTHSEIVATLEHAYRTMSSKLSRPQDAIDRIRELASTAVVTRKGKTISRVRYADGSTGTIRNSRLT